MLYSTGVIRKYKYNYYSLTFLQMPLLTVCRQVSLHNRDEKQKMKSITHNNWLNLI